MRRRSLSLKLLAISRAYSIPYLALAGLAAMLCGPSPLSLTALLLCVSIPALLTVGLAALNDGVHLRADARAGRGRDYPPALLLALGAVGTLGALALAALGGLWVLAGVVGTIVGGMAYALVKRRPALANLVRGATSVPLVLGLGALNGTSLASIWPLAVGVGLLDGAGNLWGDVRDVEVDRRGEVRTLAVVAPRMALVLAVALHGAALAPLSRYVPALWLSLLGSAITLTVAPYWRHRAFLLVKYATMGWLALALSDSPPVIALALTLSASALPAWWLYTLIHRPRKEVPYVVAH